MPDISVELMHFIMKWTDIQSNHPFQFEAGNIMMATIACGHQTIQLLNRLGHHFLLFLFWTIILILFITRNKYLGNYQNILTHQLFQWTLCCRVSCSRRAAGGKERRWGGRDIFRGTCSQWNWQNQSPVKQKVMMCHRTQRDNHVWTCFDEKLCAV